MFKERDLRRHLGTKTFGHKIYTFDTIDSTNNCAKAVANVGASEGVIVIAEEQTAGRGRLGRTWKANPDENLTFSIVLRPKVHPEEVNLLPLMAGISVAQAIEKTTGLFVECKWPNDLLIKKKKVAGILSEGSIHQDGVEYVVIGLGINVNQTAFPEDLLHRATSLRLELKREVDRTQLFQEILRSLESQYKSASQIGFQSVVPFWQERSSMLNKAILVSQSGNVVSGVVRGLTSHGGLMLQTNGSTKTFYAGDISIVGDAPDPLLSTEAQVAHAQTSGG